MPRPGAGPPTAARRLSASLLALMATAAGVAVATITVAQSLLGEIAATFGVGTGAAGVVVSATQLGYACGLVLVVPLGDIVQPRRLVAGQSLLSAGALAVAAAAPSFAVLLAAMAVVGALAVMIQVLVALAVALAPGGERGRAIGVVTGGVVAGLVAARTTAGLVNDALGWRAVFAIAAVLTVTLGAVLWRRLPPTAVASSRSYRRLVSGLPGLYRAHRVLRQRAVLALAIFATFNVLWTPLALELAGRPHRLSPTAIGLFGLVGIAGALGARRAGRLADRGHGRTASGAALALMLAAWLPIALAGWALPALVAGMVLVDVAVQTVHVVSQSQVTALDLQRPELPRGRLHGLLHRRQRRRRGGVDSRSRRPRVGGSRDPRRRDQRCGPGLLGGVDTGRRRRLRALHEDDRIARSAAIVSASQRANARSGFRVLGSCMSSHQAPQPDQPIADPRLGGSERNAEVFGDLDVGQTVEVDQFERVSLGVAQLGQRKACSIAVE